MKDTTLREKLLIIGGGMAGVKLVEELVAQGDNLSRITIVGDEGRPGYNRVLLSALLAKDVSEADIRLKDAAWYAEHSVTLITGDAVTSVDLAAKTATLASGQSLGFDRVVFATGSSPIRLPLPGSDLPGVIAFRDLNDVASMERAAADGKRIAVIGGGLLGIEAAYGLAKLGADVSLIHVMDSLMERQLDGPAAAILKREIERKGVKVLLARSSRAITGEGKVEALEFNDGTALACDMVVFAVGIRPSVALAKAAGVAVNRGIVVNDALQADQDGVYALGECAEHQGNVYGLVEPAYQQAKVLAAHLVGAPASYRGTLLATNLKVSGVPVFSAGDFMGGEGTEAIVASDPRQGFYKKLVLKGGALTGVVLIGDADDALWYLDLMRRGVDVSALRRSLAFGPAYVSAPALAALAATVALAA
jgi:nitrite reductase (NADH) large subunit